MAKLIEPGLRVGATQGHSPSLGSQVGLLLLSYPRWRRPDEHAQQQWWRGDSGSREGQGDLGSSDCTWFLPFSLEDHGTLTAFRYSRQH